MNKVSLRRDSDTFGIIASTLCLIHCLITPVLFIAPVSFLMIPERFRPWWGMLDFLFLGFSFVAVYWSTKNMSSSTIKYLFWIGWISLFVVILNEKLGIMELPEFVIYPITVLLMFLHFYNRRFIVCKTEKEMNNEV